MSRFGFDRFATDASLSKTLSDEHVKEVRRRGAKFYNEGWSATDDEIASKTDHGLLVSKINPQTKQVSHFWEDA